MLYYVLRARFNNKNNNNNSQLIVVVHSCCLVHDVGRQIIKDY